MTSVDVQGFDVIPRDLAARIEQQSTTFDLTNGHILPIHPHGVAGDDTEEVRRVCLTPVEIHERHGSAA